MEAQNVSRHNTRIELDIILMPMPDILVVTELIMQQVRLVRIDLQILKGQSHPARLGMIRIEIDQRNRNIRQIVGHLAVTEDYVVIHLEELQITSLLQGGIFQPASINALDDRSNIARLSQVPLFDFILLAVEIFFFAFDRVGQTKFERWPVNSIIRR